MGFETNDISVQADTAVQEIEMITVNMKRIRYIGSSQVPEDVVK